MLGKYSSLEGIYENLDAYTPKMRESLEAGREMAFLSQKLARIVTDLEIEEISEEIFSKKLQNPEYISLLKKYEFKSLIPKDFQEIEQKIEIVSEEILDYASFEKLVQNIKKSHKKIALSLDNYKKIFLGFDGKVYEIDSKKIDVFGFIDDIFAGNISLVAYDSKEILRELYDIRHPIGEDSMQASLF